MIQGLQTIWIGLSLGIVLILPGAAWQAWIYRPGHGLAAQWAVITGVSLAFTAIAALATFVFKFRVVGWEIAAIYAALALIAVSGWFHARGGLPPTDKVRTILSIGLTLGTAALLMAWRLYQARTLVLPAWVDSVHHVLITQVILEHGSLPGDLSPYLPVPFYYHYGFHALAAVFEALSRLPAERAVLILGQVISAGISLSAYRLSLSIWHDPRRGLAAALLIGFLSQMPAYYLTWGRYPLLAGLLLLPLAMAQALDIVQDPIKEDKAWLVQGALMAILTAGVLLSHYLAGLLLAGFLIILGLYLAWQDLSRRRISVKRWLALAGGTLVGLGASLPWLLRVFQYSTMSLSLDVVLPQAIGGTGFSTGYADYLWALAGPARNEWFLLIGGLGLVWGLARKKSRLLALWGALVALGSLPLGYKLPPFRPDHFVIVVFLPAALFAGDILFSIGDGLAYLGVVLNRRLSLHKSRQAVQDLIQAPDGDPSPRGIPKARWTGWVSTGIPSVILIGLCLWGLVETQDILNPATILVDRADSQALAWIPDHVPQDARFFINVTPWQFGIYRGVDGGWWILPLTGRWVLLPPVIYSWGSKQYVQQINDWASQATTIKGCDVQFWKLVRDANLTYAYLHQGSGTLQPDGLKECTGVEPVYQKDGVTIYTIHPEK